MDATPTIVVAGEDATEVSARWRDGTLLLEPEALTHATGWELRPEGLCRDLVCTPVRDPGALWAEGALDLRGVAEALHRPLALERDPAMVVLGEAASVIGGEMSSLHAPAFTLGDLAGNPVSLADFAGRKKLLLAWSSW